MTGPLDSWKRLGRVALLPGLLLLALYGRTLVELVHQWADDPDYSHAFLVPLFSLFLVWRVWPRLRQTPLERSWAGFVLLALGCAAFLLGSFAAENFAARISFVLVLGGLALFLLGRPAFRLVAFPIAYLAFMVPLPAVVYNAVSFPLQRQAALAAGATLEWLHIPVLLEGNVIRLSKVSLGVTEACSGVRSLMALLAASAAWAYLRVRGFWPRVVFVAATVPVAIGANMLRVIATAVIAQYFGARYAQGFFHAFSGWLIFLFAFACIAGLSLLLRRLGALTASRVRSGPKGVPAAGPAGGPDVGPADTREAASRPASPVSRAEFRSGAVLASLPLLATLIIVLLRLVDDATPLQKPLETFPLEFGQWRTRDIVPLDDRVRADLGVSDGLMRLYGDDAGSKVWLYVAYWQSQRRGATMHSPKNCLPGDGWEPVDTSRVEVPLGHDHAPIIVNRYVVEKNGRRQVVFYWYDVKGQAIAGEVRARLAIAKNSMLHNRTDGALIRVSIPILKSASEATERLAGFTRELKPLLDDHLVR